MEGEDKCTPWNLDTLDLGAAVYWLSGKTSFPLPGDLGVIACPPAGGGIPLSHRQLNYGEALPAGT